MRRRFIVSYDISDPKRLRAMHKRMRGFGDPVQLSVFGCQLSEKERIMLMAAIEETINMREDRVMIVDLGAADSSDEDRIQFIGAPMLSKAELGPTIV